MIGVSKEKDPSKGHTGRLSPLFREANGVLVRTMFGKLAKLSKHPDFYLPIDEDGVITPRLILVSASELERNRKALGNIDIEDPHLPKKVKRRVPRLDKPRGAVFNRVDVNEINGDHAVIMRLGPAGKETLGQERSQVRGCIGDLADARDLDWDQANPSLTVAVIRGVTGEKVAPHIAAYVREQLPMEVVLAPLHDPMEV